LGKKGIWEKLFQAIQQDPDMKYVMLDSTVIRANACAAGYTKDSQVQECLGRSRGDFTTKIHALTDALGNPLKFILTGGQRNDITQAIPLLKNISNTFVIGDKGYDSNELITFLQNRNCIPVIPSRKSRREPREYDTFLYQDRNRIECFFGKIKQFRRIASRFEKSAEAFVALVYFVGVLIWIR
jgi:transposase